MRKIIYFLTSILLLNCSNLSPNQYQIKSTKKNLKCFESLVEYIHNDSTFGQKLIQLRNSKSRGFDPVTTERNYRLLKLKEFDNYLPKSWIIKCQKDIVKNNDFRGLRFINKDSLIIEIDKFKRKTLNERYRERGLVEIHRIFISNGRIKNRSFKYGSEKTKFIEELENGWIYEISQMDSNN